MNSLNRLPRPTTVKPSANYTLDITFSNGERRLFDAIPYLEYPAFEALKAVSLFLQARVAYNTVVWSDEIDMAPENLYLESTPLLQA